MTNERTKKVIERLPYGQWVEHEDGTRWWEPDNPYCFYGEDCETCSREKG